MTRSVPLTESRADIIMDDLRGMLWNIGAGDEIGYGVSDRFVSCLYGHKPAFLSLCAAAMERSARIIAEHSRREIIAEFLPVVGSSMGFNSQLKDFWQCGYIRSGWLDEEIGCDGNRSNRFVVRKLPYVAFRSVRPARLIRLVQRAKEGMDFLAATVWDVLAILRSWRARLPNKCAICLMRECSWLCPKYERHDDREPRPNSHMMFFLDGTRLAIRNVDENKFVPKNTLFLSYAATTVDLLA